MEFLRLVDKKVNMTIYNILNNKIILKKYFRLYKICNSAKGGDKSIDIFPILSPS